MKPVLWHPVILRQAPLLFFIFYVLFSFEINNFNLSIDDERHAFSDPDFIPLGRWLIPAIKHTLWPQLVVPHAPYLIFGLLISLAYCVALSLARVARLELFHYACFALLVSFPVIAAQLEFSAHIIALGVSFLAAAVGVFFTIEAQFHRGVAYWLRICWSVLLCTVAAGAYQSAILNYFVILLPIVAQRTLLRQDPDFQGAIRLVATGVAVLVVATILYSLISWALIVATGMHSAKNYIGSTYVHEHANLADSIYNRVFYFIQSMYRIFFGIWYNYGIAKYVFAASILFCLAVILVHAIRSPLRFLALGALLVATLIAPGALVLVSGGQMPIRIFVAASTSLAMVFLLSYETSGNLLVRNVILALTILSVVQCMYILSTQQAATWSTQRHDLLIAGALNHDILAVVDGSADAEIRVDFFGYQTTKSIFPKVPTTMNPASFFAWDDGNPVRMVKFMNLIGFDRYRSLSDAEREAVRGDYAGMAVWPHPGSIKIVNGIVLVKLSE